MSIYSNFQQKTTKIHQLLTTIISQIWINRLGFKIFLFLLLTGVLVILIYPNLPKQITYRYNSCFILKEFSCYVGNIRQLVRSDSVEAGIQYVQLGVLPDWGYGITHMLFHTVGEEGFYKTDNLKIALKYIEPFTNTNINSDGMDGYMHGVFRGYFKKNNTTPVKDLMYQVCSEYYSEMPEEMDNHMLHMAKADECFHGVGHALMYLNNNSIQKSIEDCALANSSWMNKACLRGVFMEEMYHFAPFLSKDGKYNPDRSMLATCNGFSGVEASTCASFVGESFLLKNENKIKEAFQECRLLKTNSLEQICMNRIALLWLPFIHKNNFGDIIKVCQQESGDFINSCLHSASEGIKFGVAGSENKDKPFCSLIEDIQTMQGCQTGK